MKIIYRISDTGYNKIKPDYINNVNCLKNARYHFKCGASDWTIIRDNCMGETKHMTEEVVKSAEFIDVSIGHGAGTFNKALDIALQFNDHSIVYFLENDYLHRDGSMGALLDGFNIGADYVSLYDHPDKYLDGSRGGNPEVESGGELTRVFCGSICHWKLTNSTTMSFASRVKTLKEDEEILRKYTTGAYPEDFKMFLDLRDKGRSLVTPIPGYSTHGEAAWLSPIMDWKKCLVL